MTITPLVRIAPATPVPPPPRPPSVLRPRRIAFYRCSQCRIHHVAGDAMFDRHLRLRDGGGVGRATVEMDWAADDKE